MEQRPRSSTRIYVGGGLAALLAAVIITLLRGPPGDPGPSRSPVGTSTTAQAEVSSLTVLGPLHVGDTIGEGWKLTHIDRMPAEVQLTLTQGTTTWTLGLASVTVQKDTPIVPFPDIYVWYSGAAAPDTPDSRPDPALAALIQAVIAELRASADGRFLHERVMEWSASR